MFLVMLLSAILWDLFLCHDTLLTCNAFKFLIKIKYLVKHKMSKVGVKIGKYFHCNS